MALAPTIQTNGNLIPHKPKTGRSLRIAQIAPLYESVPPKLYGGTERVVAYLAEQLVRRGHQVTLFASGDSNAACSLRPGFAKSLRLAGIELATEHAGPALHLPMLSQVFDHAEDFDVIHSHVDFWAFPMARLSPTPTVSTMHGRLDMGALEPVYSSYPDLPLVSISDSQRAPLPGMNWAGTVYHGLPAERLRLNPDGGGYLVFLGRIAPEKCPDAAIKAALTAEIPLKLAAKVDAKDRDYFETTVRPLLDNPGIEFIGEINENEKQEFLGNALALMFPIDWPEPFGLAMIEAIACGTPVIARPCGSVPELLRQGVTGLMAESIEDLAGAARRVRELSRRECRAEFERRFTADVMAENYEKIYLRLMERRLGMDRADGRIAGEPDAAL
jgi:glycosyltransferase involved in cell wall biosynthesis